MYYVQRLLSISMYLLIILILVAVVGDLWHRKSSEEETVVVNSELEYAFPSHEEIQPSATVSTPGKKEQTPPENFQARLSRFETLKTKVVLSENELSEKERFLSHLKTVRWIETQLISSRNLEYSDRLSMVDFLEESLSWKENPVRSEIIETVEKIVQAKPDALLSKEGRRQMAGDKIELFAILAQDIPDKARTLYYRIKDPKIAKILDYAIKRLALQKELGE